MAVRSGGDLDSPTNLECNHCHSRLTTDNGPLSSGVYSGTCTVCNKPLKFWSLVDPVDQVTFQVNGIKYKISNPDPGMSLNEWIRSQPHLKGTKVMCREGGCGSCTVVVTRTDPHTGKPVTFTVNSCLYPLCGADGISVMTVEGIGSQEDGFHPIQERLAEHNGSQCGYCSPGMVMNMYGLLKQNATPSKQEVEDHFDGNICRCTGYRPILDAMKSFSKDENPIDIEELTKKCKGDCPTCPRKSVALPNSSDDALWFNPTTLKDLFTLVAKYASEKIRIVGGNTGKGVFADDGPFNIYIDVNNIADLKITKAMDDSLLVGGSVSLTNLIDLFDQNAPSYPPYAVLADHVRKVANVPVRNVGTVAGNLMLTHDHPDFPSDIFTILEAVGTKAFIVDSKTQKPLQYSLMDFLSLDMTGKIILMVSIPQSSSKSSAFVRTYKVMPRAQNAHAYVNAGFATTFDKTSMTGTSYRIVYGGIGPYATHAPKTEAFMEGKSITDPKTLQGALAILDKELVPDTPKVSASPVYRKSLGVGLFYKFYLSMLGDKASSRVKSAAVPFVRPVSSGTQAYDTHPDKFPLTKPMTKLAAKLQTSGEAVYTDDIPSQGGELFAAFVLAAQGNCKLDSIDASKAKSMPGVVDFLTSSNIPSKGVNSFSFKDLQPEEIFCSGDVLYAGQAVGLIIADTQRHADEAAWAVTVTYKEIKPQILTIPQAIAAKSFFPATSKPLVVGDAEAAIKSSSKVISGQIAMGTQHHIHMETQVCLCVPEEDGLTVHCATQWVDLLQGVVARVLGWPSNKINVNVKRCGGGYGGKATRSVQAAAALAIAASKLRRPVRIMMNFHTNMRMVGKRAPFMASYKVGVSDSGLLNGIDMTYYADYGCSSNDTDVNGAMSWCDNVYRCANWKVTPISCKTNLASNTWCRSPSSIQAIFIMESVMEHVAKSLNKTPEEVRQINLYKKGQTCPTGEALTYCNIDTLWSDLKTSSDFAKRKAAIDAFNKANRWRKRGISLVPLRFGIHWADKRFLSLVSIFHEDGSVSVSHAGVEVGQGINTKVAQVAGYCLKIPVDIIQIKSTSNLTTPNSDRTGGSVTSELCCESVILSCSILNKRMEPIRQKYKPSTWLELVQKCHKEGVNLTANAMFQGKSKEPLVYSTYGVTCTEVEIDVLTGERDIIRTDILYDCGESMNPELDVGQVEGAFVMGLGYWMTEKAIYDSKTGEELTYSTWEYKPPSSKDIPIDFRINLLKNAPNPRGILRSKAVGEPPMCMSCSALFAIKHAVQNARAEISKDANYFPLDGPAIVEDTQLACLVDYSQFTL